MPHRYDTYLFRFFVVWYAIGVILLSFHLVPPWLEWANVVFLITSGLLGIFYFIRSGGRAGITAVIIIFFGSMAVESLGVHTGLFFGNYTYETDFGPKLIGVPITIGFAWVMVLATTHVLAAPVMKWNFPAGGFLYIVYGSLAAVIMDLIIDPVAYDVKQYWVWNEGGLYYDIPFSNFAGWFILSAVFHALLLLFFRKNKRWTNVHSPFWSIRMRWLYVMMTGMFIVVALANGLVLAPVLTAVLVAAVVVFYQFMQRAGGPA